MPIHYGGPVSFVRQPVVVVGNPNIHLPRSVSGYLDIKHHTKLRWNERNKKNVVAVRIPLYEMESFNIDSGRTESRLVFPALLYVSPLSRVVCFAVIGVYIA
jgi:hypothetical protein